jgi:multiple sugar transport system substrate-binding protein
VMPDGTERPWDYTTVRDLALFLTVDANGNDATSADFDPENIVQWGFEPQRDLLASLGAYFGAGSLVGDDGAAHVPDAWRDGWKYFYEGMWDSHFIMTGPQFDDIAPDAGGYAFFSGRVAMSTNFLWTTYGVGEDSGVAGVWDLAAVPSHNGTTTSPLNADTFVLHESTENPDAAFEALTYLQVDRGAELLDIYGGLPARTDEQDAFLQGQAESFPHDVDWQVVKDSLNYPDNPNFEAFKPAYSETDAILGTYLTRWTTTAGLDLDAEIAALEAEVQAAWDAQ